MTTDRASRVVRFLRSTGVSSSRDILRATGLSQPSISLAIKDLGEDVVRFGNARSTRYGLVRSVANEGSRWPLYAVNDRGLPELAGNLVALQQGEWVFQPEPDFVWINRGEFGTGLYPGLPWFLDTLRPQGFLGRNFGRMVASTLGLPADPGDWTADQLLVAAVHHGSDFPGSFVLGDRVLEVVQSGFLKEQSMLPAEDRLVAYPRLAVSALSGEVPGSSAGGEQPKFTTVVQGDEGPMHVIVKFSGPGENQMDQRWRDLLVAESMVAEVLRGSDIPAATSGVFKLGDRTFLESVRFDRIGDFGRRFVVPLSALDGAFYGAADTPWRQAADRLEKDRLLSNEDADRLRWLWWFGNLIGNDDMHYGNVSLFSAGNDGFELAPCYDMLPMRYRPSNSGELIVREPNPALPPPQELRVWKSASLGAQDFWERVRSDDRISEEFSTIAAANLKTIENLKSRFG